MLRRRPHLSWLLVGYLLLLATFWKAPALAQTSGDSSQSDAVRQAVTDLQQQIRELQTAVAEIKAEAAEYRAEAHALRSELDATRNELRHQNYEPEVAVADAPASSAARPSEAISEVSPRPSKTSDRLAKLEEEYQLLTGKVDDQYQTKVESASKYRVRLSGILLLNLFGNSGNVDNIDFPSLALGPCSYIPRGSACSERPPWVPAHRNP